MSDFIKVGELDKRSNWALVLDERGIPVTGEYPLHKTKYKDVLTLLSNAQDEFTRTGEPKEAGRWRWRKYIPATGKYEYIGPYLHEIQVTDIVPVYDVTLKFKRLYHGSSSIGIEFVDNADNTQTLRGGDADQFMQLVADGRIQIVDGLFKFRITYSKGGDKVYMNLYGYDE